MADTFRVVNDYAPTTAAAIFTNDKGQNLMVIQASASNVDSSSAYEVITYYVPASGSAGVKQIQARRNMQEESTDILEEWLNVVLAPGDAIYTYCATGSVVTTNFSLKRVL